MLPPEPDSPRRDVALSLTYDSSPEATPLVPQKSSTPATSGTRHTHLSPLSPGKTVSSATTSDTRNEPSICADRGISPIVPFIFRDSLHEGTTQFHYLLSLSRTQTPLQAVDSLREELKEKDALIVSMNEHLKNLQVYRSIFFDTQKIRVIFDTQKIYIKKFEFFL